jgi:ketosteroid isomerase-like protein
MTDQGNYLVIAKRGTDGSWKLHHDIDNTDHPPAPTPAK